MLLLYEGASRAINEKSNRRQRMTVNRKGRNIRADIFYVLLLSLPSSLPICYENILFLLEERGMKWDSDNRDYNLSLCVRGKSRDFLLFSLA